MLSVRANHIGEDCKTYITKILDKKQHPEQSYKSCLGILHLAQKVSNTRLVHDKKHIHLIFSKINVK